jgi:hypothetical protein
MAIASRGLNRILDGVDDLAQIHHLDLLEVNGHADGWPFPAAGLDRFVGGVAHHRVDPGIAEQVRRRVRQDRAHRMPKAVEDGSATDAEASTAGSPSSSKSTQTCGIPRPKLVPHRAGSPDPAEARLQGLCRSAGVGRSSHYIRSAPPPLLQ